MIWVDYRERNSGVIEALEKSDIEYEIRNLNVGDYIIDNRVVVERKTSQDLARRPDR